MTARENASFFFRLSGVREFVDDSLTFSYQDRGFGNSFAVNGHFCDRLAAFMPEAIVKRKEWSFDSVTTFL
jgi:hypothetical protein